MDSTDATHGKLRFYCAFCPDSFPDFKQLVEHFESNHRKEFERRSHANFNQVD